MGAGWKHLGRFRSQGWFQGTVGQGPPVRYKNKCRAVASNCYLLGHARHIDVFYLSIGAQEALYSFLMFNDWTFSHKNPTYFEKVKDLWCRLSAYMTTASRSEVAAAPFCVFQDAPLPELPSHWRSELVPFYQLISCCINFPKWVLWKIVPDLHLVFMYECL